MNKFSYLVVILGVLVSLLIYRYTFSLALVGDDYLGLWRMITELVNPEWNYFNYFFTDYGPQDTLTYILYSIFGFRHWIYYLLAFVLRVAAAISIIPLVKYITKSNAASYISFLFFLVSYTGIEANDWSFNMPSFLSIIFINFHLLFLLKTFDSKFSISKYIFLSVLFMILAIVSQPIRATFMPGFTITAILINLFFTKFSQPFKSIFFILAVLVSFYLIISLTNIGLIFGIPSGMYERLTLNWFVSEQSNFAKLFSLLLNKEYLILLNPLIQFSEAIISYKILPSRFEVLNNNIEMFTMVSIQFLIFSALVTWLNLGRKWLHIFLSSFWIIVSLAYFSYQFDMPVESIKLFGIVNFGFIFIVLINYLSRKIDRNLLLVIFLSIFSFIAPWIRDPNSLQVAHNRYLIVTAATVAIMIGIFSKTAKSNYKYLFILFTLFMHFNLSYKYFYYLSHVREAKLMNKIRESIPYNNLLEDSENVVVYFIESDNPDIMYHSIGFGLPVILYFQQPVENPWNIAVMHNYSEVRSAYIDGESLTRFNITNSPLPLENIISLKIENGNLIDQSEKIRERLIKENSL